MPPAPGIRTDSRNPTPANLVHTSLRNSRCGSVRQSAFIFNIKRSAVACQSPRSVVGVSRALRPASCRAEWVRSARSNGRRNAACFTLAREPGALGSRSPCRRRPPPTPHRRDLAGTLRHKPRERTRGRSQQAQSARWHLPSREWQAARASVIPAIRLRNPSRTCARNASARHRCRAPGESGAKPLAILTDSRRDRCRSARPPG